MPSEDSPVEIVPPSEDAGGSPSTSFKNAKKFRMWFKVCAAPFAPPINVRLAPRAILLA